MGDSRPACGPSCTKFVYPVCWHFDIDATSKTDDVLTVLLFDFFWWDPTYTYMHKSYQCGGWVETVSMVWEPVSMVWWVGGACVYCVGVWEPVSMVSWVEPVSMV